jgi:hypothetical protein
MSASLSDMTDMTSQAGQLVSEPSLADLAHIEAALPERQRVAVVAYWSAVVADVLDSVTPEPSRVVFQRLNAEDKRRARRAARRAGNAALRSVASAGRGPALPKRTGGPDEKDAA